MVNVTLWPDTWAAAAVRGPAPRAAAGGRGPAAGGRRGERRGARGAPAGGGDRRHGRPRIARRACGRWVRRGCGASSARPGPERTRGDRGGHRVRERRATAGRGGEPLPPDPPRPEGGDPGPARASVTRPPTPGRDVSAPCSGGGRRRIGGGRSSVPREIAGSLDRPRDQRAGFCFALRACCWAWRFGFARSRNRRYHAAADANSAAPIGDQAAWPTMTASARAVAGEQAAGRRLEDDDRDDGDEDAVDEAAEPAGALGREPDQEGADRRRRLERHRAQEVGDRAGPDHLLELVWGRGADRDGGHRVGVGEYEQGGRTDGDADRREEAPVGEDLRRALRSPRRSSGRIAPRNAVLMPGRSGGAPLAEDLVVGAGAAVTSPGSVSASVACSARWRRRASVRSVRLARATSSSWW